MNEIDSAFRKYIMEVIFTDHLIEFPDGDVVEVDAYTYYKYLEMLEEQQQNMSIS